MQELVLIPVHDLRQIIREELAESVPTREPEKPISKPLNQRELCEFLGLTEPTVIRWRDKGKIPFLKIGSTIRYDINAVVAAIEGGKKKGATK